MKVKKLYLNINNNHMINKLSIDSKKVALNDIFYAIIGENINANDYIEEAIYKANIESINVLKLEIKILQEQYNKEYVNSD